jgi:SAM-dependent methyltransferase
VTGEFSDPRLVDIYDTVNRYRPDAQPGFYVELAAELGATTIVDLGCGTGLITAELARAGFRMIGVEPSPRMLEIARRRPGCEHVRWIDGDATALGTPFADLAIMTGHVAQFFLTDVAWDQALSALHHAMRPAGHLAFETRNPRAREWEGWTAAFRTTCEDPVAGRVDTWVELDDERDGIVSYAIHYAFAATGEELVAPSRLRFRTEAELTESLSTAGFMIDRLHGDWDRRPAGPTTPELIIVATR